MNHEIGWRIRELREIQCFSREELAEKADISAKFLYEIERNRKGFSAEILYRIAKALSVSCEYIMTGEDSVNKGNEKLIGFLEIVTPVQKKRMYEILDMLSRICSV